jgi:hypothetical protein
VPVSSVMKYTCEAPPKVPEPTAFSTMMPLVPPASALNKAVVVLGTVLLVTLKANSPKPSMYLGLWARSRGRPFTEPARSRAKSKHEVPRPRVRGRSAVSRLSRTTTDFGTRLVFASRSRSARSSAESLNEMVLLHLDPWYYLPYWMAIPRARWRVVGAVLNVQSGRALTRCFGRKRYVDRAVRGAALRRSGRGKPHPALGESNVEGVRQPESAAED